MRKKDGGWYCCYHKRVYSTASAAVSSPGVTGHATVAAVVVSIEFSAQLLLVDSPLPTFFCFISCSVFVSDSSPPSVAYTAIGCVENIPVNAAVIKTVAIANVLFIVLKCSL